MNRRRFWLGSLAVFLFIYLAEFVFHAVVMSGSYEQHLALLRPEQDSGNYMVWMALGFLLLAVGFSFIFTRGYEGRGLVEGLRYGFYVGVFFGVSTKVVNHAVFPWPNNWLLAWSVGETLIMMMAGVVIAAIYRPLR